MYPRDRWSAHRNPSSPRQAVRGVTRLRRRERTVRPQRAKLWRSKQAIAQLTNPTDRQKVLPLRTAPSQMTAQHPA